MVAVDGRPLAALIFVNAGTMANVATVPEIETVPVLTNANVINLDILPDRLLGLGGNYILA
jgi:pyruvate/2-oxoglutarate dehydrogenase complex dihydrolipoamide dehydrogenase (E3) component